MWAAMERTARPSHSDIHRKSVAVSQNGKHLPADLVVRSLNLLDANAFSTLLQDGAHHKLTRLLFFASSA
jgi:hypothetical protein